MARDDRLKLITGVEKVRETRVIAAVMGDRGGLETRIAPDIVPRVARHLRAMGKQESIDLFLYSLGGDVLAGFRLVNLIREYCDRFSVLVPFRCQSTATLIALGADEIVMLPEGQLSPVDPSTSGPYNPLIPGHVPQAGSPLPVLPVSVEDVVSYISLAREAGEIKSEAGLVEVFRKLAEDVRPLALGQVYRARTQIRMLSRKLLQMHMDPEDALIGTVVETLTEKLYSHDYVIARREAKSMGLKVVFAEGDVESAMAVLYDQYETDLELTRPFNYEQLNLVAGQPQRLSLSRAFIETLERGDAFRTHRTVEMLQPGKVSEQSHGDAWEQL